MCGNRTTWREAAAAAAAAGQQWSCACVAIKQQFSLKHRACGSYMSWSGYAFLWACSVQLYMSGIDMAAGYHTTAFEVILALMQQQAGMPASY
jgi:hypothetical protein